MTDSECVVCPAGRLFRLHVAFYLSYGPCVHARLVEAMSLGMSWGVLPVTPPCIGAMHI